MSVYTDAQEVVGDSAEAFVAELRDVMDKNGVSQADLARAAGVDPALLGRWIRGTKGPSEWTRLKLDDALQRAIYGR